jgi:hypothetical protein
MGDGSRWVSRLFRFYAGKTFNSHRFARISPNAATLIDGALSSGLPESAKRDAHSGTEFAADRNSLVQILFKRVVLESHDGKRP